MLFVVVILTFAACLFGVVAIEVSVREREERERSAQAVSRRRGSSPVPLGGRPRRGAAENPPADTGTSRAA